MIPQFVINDPVTWVWESHSRVKRPAICLKVLNLLWTQSASATLPTSLAPGSADGAKAAETAVATREGTAAMLPAVEVAASSLPGEVAEPEPARSLRYQGYLQGPLQESESACLVSKNNCDSQVPRSRMSRMHKDVQREADRAPTSDNANRQQFLIALLEDCRFFAHLVLRQVRAGRCSAKCLSRQGGSNLGRISVVKTSPTSNSLVQPSRLEASTLSAEPSSPTLQILWVDVAFRHMQTLVAQEKRHDE